MDRFCLKFLSIAMLFFLSCFSAEKEYPILDFLGPEYTSRISRMMSEDNYSSRFVIMHNLLKQVLSNEGGDALRSFIHQYTLIDPHDPFNSYYLLLIAEYYRTEDPQMSDYYYNQILTLYNNVIVEDQSTHYLALENLLSRVSDPSQRILYYMNLLTNFRRFIDPGLTWYHLSQEYRRNGEFEKYFEALSEFQNYSDTVIQGMPDIHQQIAKELDFHFNSRKDWTHPDLIILVENIKQALSSKQAQVLERYRAKETFFAMSWLQDSSDFNSRPRFDVGHFLLNASRISYATDFTIVNEAEAYLKTWGWSYRIPNWYFYFRKVDYPADPEIHGNWEWAGIFFGDTL